jgi:hypothetical protein
MSNLCMYRESGKKHTWMWETGEAKYDELGMESIHRICFYGPMEGLYPALGRRAREIRSVLPVHCVVACSIPIMPPTTVHLPQSPTHTFPSNLLPQPITPPRQTQHDPAWSSSTRSYCQLASFPYPASHSAAQKHSPLNSPLHHAVRRDERRDDVKNLVPCPPHSVPCSLGEKAGKGALAIGAHGVDDRAFAGLASALVGVAPATDVPSTRCTLAVPSQTL